MILPRKYYDYRTRREYGHIVSQRRIIDIEKKQRLYEKINHYIMLYNDINNSNFESLKYLDSNTLKNINYILTISQDEINDLIALRASLATEIGIQ